MTSVRVSLGGSVIDFGSFESLAKVKVDSTHPARQQEQTHNATAIEYVVARGKPLNILSSTSAALSSCIVAASFAIHRELAAFEANAIAYLLKPVEPSRLHTALERVRCLLDSATERAQEEERVQAVAGAVRRLQRVVARKGNQVLLLDPADIFWIYMDGGIVKARTATESYWLNYQLAQLEKGLDPEAFFRARRDVLVNLHKVRAIKPYDRSTFGLMMADSASTELPVSERQAKKLRQRLPGL